MKIEYYVSPEDAPAELIEELASCAHAGEAEKVFTAWADDFFVPERERAHFWLTAEA